MSCIRMIIASTACIGFAGLLNAQNPGLPAKPLAATPAANADLPSLRVVVSQLSESRSSQGSGGINLTLSVVGEGLPPDAAVRRVTVTKAVDNNDKPLPPGRAGMSMSPMSIMNRMPASSGLAEPMRAMASLGVASRNADSIKYVEGTMEVFVPSESNGSIIRIASIKSHLGRVEDPTLAKHGIVFHFLGDKASEDEARALMLGGGGGSPTRIDSVTGFGYYFQDPSSSLVGVLLQDGRGRPFGRGGGGGGGGGPNGSLMSFALPSPILDDTQLVIYVAVPEAIKTVPFRVEDITLP